MRFLTRPRQARHWYRLALMVLCLLICSSCSTVEQATSTLTDQIGTLMNQSAKISSNKVTDTALRVQTSPANLPTLGKDAAAQNDVVWIDTANANQGYVMVQYLGKHTGKIKFQITGPDQLTYTFNLAVGADFEVFPLTGGSGSYTFNTFEQASGTSYYVVNSLTEEIAIENETMPYLYPNQFVNFNEKSSVVAFSAQAATDVYSEIELISNIYYQVMDTLSYDTAMAEEITAGGLVGYVPNLDEVLARKTGICFDYASLMVAMLRIQGMPAKLVIGYAGEAYHAWINVYTAENGWINEVIIFDGKDWSLMDPTFADTGNNNAATNYVGDGVNYTEKYVY